MSRMTRDKLSVHRNWRLIPTGESVLTWGKYCAVVYKADGGFKYLVESRKLFACDRVRSLATYETVEDAKIGAAVRILDREFKRKIMVSAFAA